MLMTTVVAETMTQPSKIVMDANWKWDATAGPRWVAPFMGTNDQIKLPMEVMTQKLSSFAAEEVELGHALASGWGRCCQRGGG